MKRAVVIGLGTISMIHLAAIQKDPDIALAAVCDINEEKAASAPQGVPFYTDYMKMIRAVRPDAAHICLPHYLHVPVSMAVASEGVNVLCEKPVALNASQAYEFEDFAEDHPEVHIGIVLQNRLNRSVRVLKEILDSKEYGKVTGTRGFVPWYRPENYYETTMWRAMWSTAGGGSMINQAVHTLDLLYYLGGEIGSVRAMVGQLLDYGIEVEDTVAAQLYYTNGAKGLFFSSNANFTNESVQIAVQTEKAQFLIRDNMLFRVQEDGQQNLLAEDDRFPGTKFYYGASHAQLIHNFYECLETGSDQYIKVSDAVMSIRLIDAIQQAGRFGRLTVV